jgi:polyhydroxybutyrate depolymerase
MMAHRLGIELSGRLAAIAPVVATVFGDESANDCRSTPERRDDGPSVVSRYICPPGRDVEIHLVRDNGHAWPGGERGSRLGDEPSATSNATDTIWEFFEAQSR